MILQPAPFVSTDKLSWSGPLRAFLVEASDIGPFGRVYGLTLTSRYPGREPIVFAVHHVERDAEGDITYWDLKPADFRERGFFVRVFNN